MISLLDEILGLSRGLGGAVEVDANFDSEGWKAVAFKRFWDNEGL